MPKTSECDTRRLTLRLPLAVVRQLRIRAAMQDVSVNQYVCQALEQALAKEQAG